MTKINDSAISSSYNYWELYKKLINSTFYTINAKYNVSHLNKLPFNESDNIMISLNFQLYLPHRTYYSGKKMKSFFLRRV
jgi:hypothetical protein